MIVEDVNFKNGRGQSLAGRIYREEAASGSGVIFCHGMFSNKDGYKITRMAGDIAAAGFTLLTFDFSFTGESGSAISELSIIQEVDDLECAVEYFRRYGIDASTSWDQASAAQLLGYMPPGAGTICDPCRS